MPYILKSGMLNSIKISIKETLIYGLGNIAVKFVGLILIPIFTNPRFFTVDDFGIIGILDISGLVLIALFTFLLPQSLTRWFWDKEHKENQKGIFFMTILTQLVISIIFSILLIPLSGTISELIFERSDLSGVIVLLILGSAIQVLNNVINTLMMLQSRSVLYTLTNLSKLVVVLTLTLYFIISKGMGIKGIYLAQLCGNIFFIILLGGYTISNSRIYFEMRAFREMTIYGLPLFLGSISSVLLTVVDRFSLNALGLLKNVALYTLAFKITSVLKLVIVDSIKLALAPMMLKKMDSPDNKRYYSKIMLYTSYVLMFGIVAISLFSFEIIKVMTKSREFWNAVVIIPILSLSVFFVNMKEVTVYGLHIAKKSKIIGSIVVFATLISIFLNILLIPIWDITGAALATLISQFIYWLACHYFSQRVYFIPFENGKLFILFICGVLLSFVSLLLNDLSLLPRLALKTITLVSFPFILYFFHFYEPVELQSIKGFITKWSKIRKFGDNLKSLKGITDDM